MQQTPFKTFNCNTQVDSWQDANTGFESLLKSREGRRLFEEFLKKEFSSENIQVILVILVILVIFGDDGDFGESDDSKEFLEKEMSIKNFQFWNAAEQLKSLRGGEKIFRQHVDVIFKIYINDTALSEVCRQ